MIAEELAEYAYNLDYSDLSGDVIHQVKRHFIDSLGCAISAKNSPPVEIIKKSFGDINFLPLNAFLYGAMIRYLDYNDTYLSKEPAHPSDNFGAVLAVAEAVNASPKEFILASALAYEIQCRLCDAASLRKNGWDHVIYGSVSSGLSAGKLMGLSKEELTQTINISLSTNISTRQVREASELSLWKACAFSNVARNAVFSAILAKNGMKGPNEIFEGKFGIMNKLTGKFELHTEEFGKSKSHFKIQDCWIKKWPAEIHSQSAIQSALELRNDIKSISEIEKIEIETHEAGYTIIGSGNEKWEPKTRETADHSLPYIVASSLFYGRIDKEIFSENAFRNKELLSLVKKITVKEKPELTKLYPSSAPNRIKITLRTGKLLEKEVLYHRGHPKNQMDDSEIEGKFNSLTAEHLQNKEKEKLLCSIWDMEKSNKFNWNILRIV